MTNTTQLKKQRHTVALEILAVTALGFVFWAAGITPDFGWILPGLGLLALVLNGVIFDWRIRVARSRPDPVDPGGHVSLLG